MEIKLTDYQYKLPSERIASRPLERRSDSRLLVYRKGNITDSRFHRLSEYLLKDSWLLFNNTRVIQARLKFRKESGALIEVFCLEPVRPASYEEAFHCSGSLSYLCLVGNARKWKEGRIYLDVPVGKEVVRLYAEREERLEREFILHFSWDGGLSFGEILDAAGSTPIPPYLNREAEEADKDRYQTVYSRNEGSVAAPTAGLHFTDKILAELSAAGKASAELSLHVGAGTFVPVRESNARQHQMHREQVVVRRSFLEFWKAQDAQCIAVGTTSTRSIESLYWLGVKLSVDKEADPDGLELRQWENENLPGGLSREESIAALLTYMDRNGLAELHFATSLMIVPGYQFRAISGLITNFHMPGSTLLMLIAALIGDDWQRVYDFALENDYRFLSYGDSSLLLPDQAP